VYVNDTQYGLQGLSNSLALAGMEATRVANAARARCEPGYRFYLVGGGAAAEALTGVFFCAPGADVAAYSRSPRFAEVRLATARERDGSGSAKLIRWQDPVSLVWSNAVVAHAASAACASCDPGFWRARVCSPEADTLCSPCVCGALEAPVGGCDGTSTSPPKCVACEAAQWRGDAYGNNWLASSFRVTEEGRALSTIRCQPGTYNVRSGQEEETSECDAASGWSVSSQVCRPCDPPRVPLAVAPYPALGSTAFTYTCAPGYVATYSNGTVAPEGVALMCPVAGNLAGTEWSGLGTFDCTCAGIGSTHACALVQDAPEKWANEPGGADVDGEGWLRHQYTATPGGGWVAGEVGSGGAGDLLGAVRVTFRLRSPRDEELEYVFRQVPDAEVAAGGVLVLSNDDQYYGSSNRDSGGSTSAPWLLCACRRPPRSTPATRCRWV
jgi:hypothetical protein